MPAEGLDLGGGNLGLAIFECEHSAEGTGAVGDPQGFEGDGVEAAAAESGRSGIKQALRSGRFQMAMNECASSPWRANSFKSV